MQQKSHASSWFLNPNPNIEAKVRLFCFPYAGGGASLFRTWSRGLLPDVEVWAMQLPGRENRLQDVLIRDLPEVVETLAHVLLPYLTLPFAFFGHSLGAFIAFELVRKLRIKNGPVPLHLLVSGQRAPHIPNPFPPLHQLPDPDFLEGLNHRYSHIPESVLQCKKFMQLLLPVLRADFTMHETYKYKVDAPVDCPITAFGGLQDPEVGEDDLSSWADQTNNAFTSEMFSGDHFFLECSRTDILRAVAKTLKLRCLMS